MGAIVFVVALVVVALIIAKSRDKKAMRAYGANCVSGEGKRLSSPYGLGPSPVSEYCDQALKVVFPNVLGNESLQLKVGFGEARLGYALKYFSCTGTDNATTDIIVYDNGMMGIGTGITPLVMFNFASSCGELKSVHKVVETKCESEVVMGISGDKKMEWKISSYVIDSGSDLATVMMTGYKDKLIKIRSTSKQLYAGMAVPSYLQNFINDLTGVLC